MQMRPKPVHCLRQFNFLYALNKSLGIYQTNMRLSVLPFETAANPTVLVSESRANRDATSSEDCLITSYCRIWNAKQQYCISKRSVVPFDDQPSVRGSDQAPGHALLEKKSTPNHAFLSKKETLLQGPMCKRSLKRVKQASHSLHANCNYNSGERKPTKNAKTMVSRSRFLNAAPSPSTCSRTINIVSAKPLSKRAQPDTRPNALSASDAITDSIYKLFKEYERARDGQLTQYCEPTPHSRVLSQTGSILDSKQLKKELNRLNIFWRDFALKTDSGALDAESLHWVCKSIFEAFLARKNLARDFDWRPVSIRDAMHARQTPTKKLYGVLWLLRVSFKCLFRAYQHDHYFHSRAVGLPMSGAASVKRAFLHYYFAQAAEDSNTALKEFEFVESRVQSKAKLKSYLRLVLRSSRFVDALRELVHPQNDFARSAVVGYMRGQISEKVRKKCAFLRRSLESTTDGQALSMFERVRALCERIRSNPKEKLPPTLSFVEECIRDFNQFERDCVLVRSGF